MLKMVLQHHQKIRMALRCGQLRGSPVGTRQFLSLQERSLSSACMSRMSRRDDRRNGDEEQPRGSSFRGPLMLSGYGAAGVCILSTFRKQSFRSLHMSRIATCDAARDSSPVAKEQQPSPVEFAPDRHVLPEGVYLEDCTITLYQFDSCPFCRKVRATLDFCGIPYHVREVHPLSKKELRDLGIQYKKVPVLKLEMNDKMCHGERTDDGDRKELSSSPSSVRILTDSKRIVFTLLDLHCSRRVRRASSPSEPIRAVALDDLSPEQTKRIYDRVLWGDEELGQIIVVNIYRTISESYDTFRYLLTHPKFSLMEKMAGSLSGTIVMNMVARRRKKQRAITDERAAIAEAVNEFLQAFPEGGRFHGGHLPDAADFNIYGMLRSVEGMKAEKDLWAATNIGEWYARVQEVCGADKAVDSNASIQPRDTTLREKDSTTSPMTPLQRS